MVAKTPGRLSRLAGRTSYCRWEYSKRDLATALNITDDLDGPRELLEELDWTLRLPAPDTGWDF